MSVYKVLVQKFGSDTKAPFQTQLVEVCADRFHVDAQETLTFHNYKLGTIAAFAPATWYRVEKVECCECGCDEQATIPASSKSVTQGTTETLG